MSMAAPSSKHEAFSVSPSSDGGGTNFLLLTRSGRWNKMDIYGFVDIYPNIQKHLKGLSIWVSALGKAGTC